MRRQCCRRVRSSTWWHGTIIRQRAPTIPIRSSGWAGAIVPWMKWRMRGSMSLTSAMRIISSGWQIIRSRHRMFGRVGTNAHPGRLVMKRHVSFLAAGALMCCVLLCAQQQLKVEPPHDSGQGVTPAYEGYFENSDGSLSILFGYYNRNVPGGPDRGQPTHFLTARQWGVFTVTVPKGFNDRLTWSLTANGKTSVVPANLNPLYLLSPFKDATDNTPPFIGFTEAGPFVQGPRGHSTSLTTNWPNPVQLNLWVADDASVAPGARRPSTPPVTISLSKYRGPGSVTFTPERPVAEKAEFKAPPSATFTGKVTASAKFSQPGEFILRVVANDWSGVGGAGFQCCWTNAQIKVSVSPAGSSGR